ncbi:MAG: pyridoxamine 5'-phosphate oxidase family protein [Granulosicoccus sp.]
MGHKFAEIAFTNSVKLVQESQGSRDGYASWDQGVDVNRQMGDREIDFISERDSFYLASVSETGWPYVQHRGGPAGFVRVLDNQTIGYSDFAGNRQYVSFGNVCNNDRVSLIFMDYRNRQRLKVLGRIRLIAEGDSELLDQLRVQDYRVRIERSFQIAIEAFDWNCPKYITKRYTEFEMTQLTNDLKDENAALRNKYQVDAAREQL